MGSINTVTLFFFFQMVSYLNMDKGQISIPFFFFFNGFFSSRKIIKSDIFHKRSMNNC